MLVEGFRQASRSPGETTPAAPWMRTRCLAGRLREHRRDEITLVIRYRLPGMIWTMLLALAVVAMAMGGYATGISGSRQLLAMTLFAALAFSIVLALPVALDRPHHDLSASTRAPMVALEKSIHRSIQSEHLPQ